MDMSHYLADEMDCRSFKSLAQDIWKYKDQYIREMLRLISLMTAHCLSEDAPLRPCSSFGFQIARPSILSIPRDEVSAKDYNTNIFSPQS
jgi:hypothetical protein